MFTEQMLKPLPKLDKPRIDIESEFEDTGQPKFDALNKLVAAHPPIGAEAVSEPEVTA